MLFNTIDFIIFFVVFITIIVAIKDRQFQHIFLLFGSYFFFYYTSNYLIVLLIFTTIWDYYFGNYIYKAKDIKMKKLILIISLAGNLGLLGFFKYADFAITQINFLGNHFDFSTNIPLLNLALPIAISFYTFHSITYTVSIYRNQISPSKSFTEYAIFVSFFPQLVAGPILRAKEFLPQLREKLDNFGRAKLRQIVIEPTNLKIGITMIAFGFLKKLFFADNIAPLVSNTLGNPMGLDSLTIILGAIGFGIQIYCDFSGYSDIAIGAALIMGFKIPINFNKPYFATSPSNFWRRWHISLSTWLRDYLYIPLGGNKKSKHRTYVNLFLVMILGGLWHGASLNFIIWGILHGIYLSIHKLFCDFMPSRKLQFFNTKIGKITVILITQYFVFLAWIPFRIQDTDMIFYAMSKYIIIDFHFQQFQNTITGNLFSIALIGLFILLSFLTFKKNLLEKISNLNLVFWSAFLIIVIMSVLFFFDGNPENFIYFQF